MEGYLEKQKKKGMGRSRWVRRYFKTIGNHLCYSEKKEPYKVIGSIPLDETSFSRPDSRDPLTITMSVKDGRSYDLRAENEHDATAWRSFFATFAPPSGLIGAAHIALGSTSANLTGSGSKWASSLSASRSTDRSRQPPVSGHRESLASGASQQHILTKVASPVIRRAKALVNREGQLAPSRPRSIEKSAIPYMRAAAAAYQNAQGSAEQPLQPQEELQHEADKPRVRQITVTKIEEARTRNVTYNKLDDVLQLVQDETRREEEVAEEKFRDEKVLLAEQEAELRDRDEQLANMRNELLRMSSLLLDAAKAVVERPERKVDDDEDESTAESEAAILAQKAEQDRLRQIELERLKQLEQERLMLEEEERQWEADEAEYMRLAAERQRKAEEEERLRWEEEERVRLMEEERKRKEEKERRRKEEEEERRRQEEVLKKEMALLEEQRRALQERLMREEAERLKKEEELRLKKEDEERREQEWEVWKQAERERVQQLVEQVRREAADQVLERKNSFLQMKEKMAPYLPPTLFDGQEAPIDMPDPRATLLVAIKGTSVANLNHVPPPPEARKRTAGGEPEGVRQSLIEALSSRRFFFLTDDNEEEEEGASDDRSDEENDDYGAEWSEGSDDEEDWTSVCGSEREERTLDEPEAERGELGAEGQAGDEGDTTSDTARREEPEGKHNVEG